MVRELAVKWLGTKHNITGQAKGSSGCDRQGRPMAAQLRLLFFAHVSACNQWTSHCDVTFAIGKTLPFTARQPVHTSM